jgi:SpoVK/Ycf46/Vps4 family AAA+-type ATPase
MRTETLAASSPSNEHHRVAESRLLRKLVKAGVEARTDDFRRTVEEVVREERSKKHHLLANDLERLLARDIVTTPKPNVVVPHDRERGLPLVDVREPGRGLDELVLSRNTERVLRRVLDEHRRADVLASYGLRPSSKLLFAGPPGTGKTSAAEALAHDLGLDLVIVRVDAIISSFLGETAANLRKVFEFLEQGRYLALFDEFDALGKERDDPSEHGEIRRVVNAFLQQFDAYRGRSILVAATNHDGLLDRALWRRFDEIVTFPLPTPSETSAMLALLTRSLRHDLPLSRRTFVARMKGKSQADVERVFRRAIRSMVLSDSTKLTLETFLAALADERRQKPTRRR